MRKVMLVGGANDWRGAQNPRYKWLAKVILERGYTIGAEIGCDLGTTTRYLLSNCPDLFLYAVDIWERRTAMFKEHGKWRFHPDIHFAENTFNKRMKSYHNRIKISKGLSWEMASKVPDGSLDFIFIDADHSYEATKKDILAWSPKVKEGGMISGHDINMAEVKQAVQELIPNYKQVKIDHCWEAKQEVHIYEG